MLDAKGKGFRRLLKFHAYNAQEILFQEIEPGTSYEELSPVLRVSLLAEHASDLRRGKR